MATFSPTSASIEGFRVAMKHPGALVFWGLFYIVAILITIGVVFMAMGPGFLDALKNASANASASADPTAALKMLGGLFLGFLIAVPVLMVVVTMLNAAVFRAVLRPEEKGIAYLRLGGDELRMIAVAFVIGLLFMAVYIVFVLVIGGTIGVLSAGGGNGRGSAGLIAFPLGLLMFCAFVYVGVKLSLASVMTFAEKRIRIFESWSLTNGHFWPLLGMYLLVFLIIIGVAIVVGVLSSVFTAMMGAGLYSAFSGHAPQLTSVAPVAITGLVLYVIVTALHSALQMALVVAPQASAYRQLTGDGAKAAEVF